jgi:ribosomal protein S18 acetylase RimI-like enzyme
VSRVTRDDLTAMLELCQERWPDARCGFGQIAFWSARLQREGQDAKLVDGGWGFRDGRDLDFDGADDAVEEILEWAQAERVFAPPRDAELLARHGLRHDPDGVWWKINSRSLDGVEEPVVPAGYRLTTMAEYDDYASRAAAHRSAFAPGSRMTEDVYALVRGGWPYRPELDCVCLAPDGSVASFALAWLDERNATGELEPVGTHEDHRRLGLGRATNLFALERLRAAGAGTAVVACLGQAPAIACRLYAGVGFEELARTVTFTRAA